MAENRRFYYLKLKEGFYNSETMVVLESMPDGLLYSNLLLKMYLMSLKSGGILMLNEHLPHTVQTIAIDSRYRSNKPLIVTTNMKLDEPKHPPDLAHARIYDRILECCAPILFAGKNFREDTAASTKAAARCIVSADHSKI